MPGTTSRLESRTGLYTVQMRWQYRDADGLYRLKLDTWDDNGTFFTLPWVTFSDGQHAIRLEWWTADEPGDNDGGLRLWIDGLPQGELLGLDNDEKVIGFERLGALGIDPGTNGSFYLDAFRSWQGDRSRDVISSESFDDGVLP